MHISTSEQQMLSLVCSVFDAYTVTLFLPLVSEADDEPVLVLAAWFSLGDNVLEDTHIRSGQGLVGQIAARKMPIDVPDFNPEEERLLYYAVGTEDTVKSFMGCPLPSGGALCVDTKRQYAFTDRDKRHLQMFATILDGVHTLNSFERSISEIPAYFSKIKAMAELVSGYRRWDVFIANFLSCVAAATGFDYCAFASVEVPGESFSISAENQPILVHNSMPFFQSMDFGGLAGWVFRNGQAVFLSGEDGDAPPLFGTSDNLPSFSATVCLPLDINMTTSCCLCLGHQRPMPITQPMRDFLHTSATLLQLHAENLYLGNRLRSLMDSATVYRTGPRKHDPDTEPYQPRIDSSDL